MRDPTWSCPAIEQIYRHIEQLGLEAHAATEVARQKYQQIYGLYEELSTLEKTLRAAERALSV